METVMLIIAGVLALATPLLLGWLLVRQRRQTRLQMEEAERLWQLQSREAARVCKFPTTPMNARRAQMLGRLADADQDFDAESVAESSLVDDSTPDVTPSVAP